MTNTIRIATRQSDLALWQAHHIGRLFRQHHPELTYTLIPILTPADRHQLPLSAHGGKGQFVKAIQAAVLSGEADIAVHSAKDLPCVTTPGLTLAAVPKRASAQDVWVSHHDIMQIAPQSQVGTSSPRRAIQLLKLRPDLIIKNIRGNVPTRVQQWQTGDYDALILAEAGLTRLNMTQVIHTPLDKKAFIPAAGQGALAIECQADNTRLRAQLARLNDAISFAMLTAERHCMFALGAHCFAPIGALAEYNHQQLSLRAFVGDKKHYLFSEAFSPLSDAKLLGQKVADKLNEKGAQNILNSSQTGG